MPDQAARLREIAVELRSPLEKPYIPDSRMKSHARVCAVASGKGGVGKTSIAVNLALKLRGGNSRVLLIDTDVNLANADIIMGISPQQTLADALIKDVPVEEIIHACPGGIHFLPGGSGFLELTRMKQAQCNRMINQLTALEKKYDYMVLDTQAGLHKQVLDYLAFAAEIIIVATPEPTSIADAYAMVKVITIHGGKRRIRVVINQVKSPSQGKEIFQKFKMVVDRFLQVPVSYLGHISDDRNVSRAVIKQKPLVLEYPKSPASYCISAIAERLVRQENGKNVPSDGSFFKKVVKFSLFH